MRLNLLRTRFFQVTVLVLLIVSVAQVAWWIVDQSNKAGVLRQRLTEVYGREVMAAEELRNRGAEKATLERLFPYLEIDASGEIVIAPDVLEGLRTDRARWLNQYGWEGGFFLVVLVISMAAVWRALHEESVLRRRQQNFIAAVSHELKSPLASMQLSVETLSLREPSREGVRKLTDRMAADIARMMNMITKILDAAKLDQPRITLHPESVPLAEALRRVLDELEERRQRSSARVEVDIEAGLNVLADPLGVGTVLLNLLENAFRAVAANSGGEVRIQAEPADGFVHLTIEDDGVGFRSEEASLLFDKFYRPGDEMRRRGSGQGLGLYIVRRFIELEKGRIRAHSDGTGTGATFEVWWPIARKGAA